MKAIIDAYNLYYQSLEYAEVHGRLTLSQFATVIGRWSTKAGMEVFLVFDGNPPPQLARERYGGGNMSVRFTGSDNDADSYIIQFIKDYSGSKDLIVISSDREIRREANRQKCKIMKSDEFWPALIKRLTRRPGPKEPREKHAGLTPTQREYWLREFGFES